MTIHWLPERAPEVVEVAGIDPDVGRRLQTGVDAATAGARVFSVFAEQGERGNAQTAWPPMAGRWSWVENRLRFAPQFPLTAGLRYRAEYRPPKGPPVVSFFELAPQSMTPVTAVQRIFPSADVLPENQLKFYVEFTGPMSRGGTYEHVRLRAASGEEIELPFLELDEELWDLSMTRLTLLIDPGRIKRGVKPLEDIGPVFEAGKSYTLSLDAECRDARGRPLRSSFEKTFRVGPADRSPPDPRRWAVKAPAAGTRQPLRVEFDEPMDQALALRLITVVDGARGKSKVAGESTLNETERVWSFVPDEPWQRAPYQLAVATMIEDLAGNNIGKTFDVDLRAGAQPRLSPQAVKLKFDVQ